MIDMTKLRREMVERDTNFHRLQKDAGLSSETINRIRNGGFFRMSVVDRICAVLGCQPCDIMEHREDEE